MTKKKNIIAENFTLPSLGKVYNGDIDPNVTLTSMTTRHEMMRLAKSERPMQNLCDIIDDCIESGPDISSYDMCLGDYVFLLYKLRTVTYGPIYTISSTCPFCGFKNEDDLNLDELPVYTYTDEVEKYREFDLPVSKKKIRLRLQTPRMLDDIAINTKDYKRKTDKSQDPSLLFTLEQLIEEYDGHRPDPIMLREWIKDLPMKDTNTILQYSDKLNKLIGIDSQLVNTCDLCSLDYPTTLHINQEFFRPALSI